MYIIVIYSSVLVTVFEFQKSQIDSHNLHGFAIILNLIQIL